MSIDQTAISNVIAKDEIRELALLYCRGVDRKDPALLRSLYTKDATDHHASFFSGPADEYVDVLEGAMPHMHYSGHHVCNHLISVNGDEGEGEVCAIAYHIVPDGKGGWLEDFMCVRYIDRYRVENGRWRFSKRVVTYDMRSARPVPAPESAMPNPIDDPSYTVLSSRLFARGRRN